MENKTTLTTVLIVQIVTLIGVFVGAYVSVHNTNVAKQRELETQLILNAYSLPDSTAQIERLRNFCELKFFEEERRLIIEEKIKKGTMSVTSSALVYICLASSATRFHTHFCPGLKKCTDTIEKVALEKAITKGYSPCGYCFDFEFGGGGGFNGSGGGGKW